jgi:hypothetical protein
MTDLTKAEVAQKVREYIAGRDVDGVTLEVIENEIVQVNGWWRVPVRPSAWSKRLSSYYEALADIEATIDENEGLNILLSSGQPADVEAVAAG